MKRLKSLWTQGKFWRLCKDSEWRVASWESEAPAEPNLSANREIGKSAGREGQQIANSFLEGSAPALPKNFQHIRRCALRFCQPLEGRAPARP
jgi:hypothetical protein